LACIIKGERIQRKVVAMGSIRCSEICIAGSVIFYSHMQHFKKSEQPNITITRLFLVTLQSAVRREIKFHVTVHITTCSCNSKSQPLINHYILVNCHNLFTSSGLTLSLTVSWDVMPCLPNYTALHRRRQLDTTIENFSPQLWSVRLNISHCKSCALSTPTTTVPTLVAAEDPVMLVDVIFNPLKPELNPIC